jgi:hypothetical protein
MDALKILAIVAMAIVAIILGFGFYALNRGGEFGAKWSNRLMRYRIMAQAVAVILLLLIAVVARGGH